MHEGMESCSSRHSVDEIVSRLEALLTEKGIQLFCVVDHSGEAAEAGLKMPSTKVLIFGSARAGTPLMLAAPSVALDLPLRILVAEAVNGGATLSWNAVDWLQQRHGFPAELVANIRAAENLARKAAEWKSGE